MSTSSVGRTATCGRMWAGLSGVHIVSSWPQSKFLNVSSPKQVLTEVMMVCGKVIKVSLVVEMRME